VLSFIARGRGINVSSTGPFYNAKRAARKFCHTLKIYREKLPLTNGDGALIIKATLVTKVTGRKNMDINDVDKLQQDLDAVRDALGCELPFGRDDIRMSLAVAVTMGFWCVWTLFTHVYWLILLGAVPMILLAIGGTVWVWRRWRARRREQPLAAKGNARDIRISVVWTLAFFGFVAAGWKLGFAIHLWMVMVCCFGAVSLLLLGMTGRSRRRYLAVALGMGAVAAVIYFFYDGPAMAAGDSFILPAMAAVATLTSLADAGIMHVQLRRSRGV